MKLYEQERHHPFRWIVAILIFILAMTITFDDAYGLWTPSGTDRSASEPQQTAAITEAPQTKQDDPPPQVAEPATLILIGSGLAAMYVLRRRKK